MKNPKPKSKVRVPSKPKPKAKLQAKTIPNKSNLFLFDSDTSAQCIFDALIGNGK